MPLRRFQPISRAAQWSETVRWIDVRTRQPQSLADATLTMGLYQHERGCGWRRDYGRLFPGTANPVLSAATQADGSGPFVILADGLTGQWTFPSSALSNLWPGDALLVVWVTIGGQMDEIQRATIQILDGPSMVPLVMSVPTATIIPGVPSTGSPAQQATALAALIATLPTTLPSQPNVLWNNGGVLQLS